MLLFHTTLFLLSPVCCGGRAPIDERRARTDCKASLISFCLEVVMLLGSSLLMLLSMDS